VGNNRPLFALGGLPESAGRQICRHQEFITRSPGAAILEDRV